MELKTAEKCVINTGNILSINDITRKSGQNPTEELIEAINITLKEHQNGNLSAPHNDKVLIHRPNDDLKAKMEEQSLADLKIGLKIFLNNDSTVLIQEAIEEGFATLKVPCVQNVVLQYKKDKISEAGDDISSLKNIWSVLEEYVKNEKISQIGLADVEEATFRNVFEWATVKPSIIQINLATCCVVPPTLQAFCKDNDVQLLTHSDPAGSIPSLAAGLLFGSALAYGAYQVSQDSSNYSVQLVTSSILAGVMGYRFYNSGKIMPAGVVCALSGVMIVRIALRAAGLTDRKIT
ncbi:glutamate--cysteine ligase regulatory subunit [Asbolus verrucosus]|uniref:GCS light chain n=1 Tax=Asbolus verrucosus TaxID=1661398 RepID=A0A482VK02_ASBVE|nr:glutamate--cysteine ligase regulatory subunit [Asbolus verrucosus]